MASLLLDTSFADSGGHCPLHDSLKEDCFSTHVFVETREMGDDALVLASHILLTLAQYMKGCRVSQKAEDKQLNPLVYLRLHSLSLQSMASSVLTSSLSSMSNFSFMTTTCSPLLDQISSQYSPSNFGIMPISVPKPGYSASLFETGFDVSCFLCPEPCPTSPATRHL